MSTNPTAKDKNTLAQNPSPVEVVKDRSDYLRGTIDNGLADELSGGIADSDQNLLKFHGIYQQDNRDERLSRTARKLEPDYSFMIRLRVPGGMLSASQWLTVDAVASELTETGSIRLTTRQTLQFHGVAKDNLRPLLKNCAKRLLDSIAACGDVNRNVMCSPHAGTSAVHQQSYEAAAAISQALLPNTRAYFEIWLGEEKLAASPTTSPTYKDAEPLYGKHYLPRKFKIGIAVPPSNDVDVFSQDIGYVAVAKDNKLRGFNVYVGGGLGMTHGDRQTAPHIAKPLGFCAPSQAAEVAWHIATIQRDYGNRSERKQARFKYTVAKLGIDFIRNEVMKRAGFVLPLIPETTTEETLLTHRADPLGWRQAANGTWDLTIYIENGRIGDDMLRECLREAAALDCCDFLMTPNQNIMLVNINQKDKERIAAIFARRLSNIAADDFATHGFLADGKFGALSGMRKNAMACVAFPTCPLAMAESERFLPSLLDRLQNELSRYGLEDDAISIRMTGCPNGCARPYLAEIGLVGKSPGRYNLYLGAAADGSRLSSFVADNLDDDAIIKTLSPLFSDYASERNNNESFGDFLVRTNKARIPQNAADFHP